MSAVQETILPPLLTNCRNNPSCQLASSNIWSLVCSGTHSVFTHQKVYIPIPSFKSNVTFCQKFFPLFSAHAPRCLPKGEETTQMSRTQKAGEKRWARAERVFFRRRRTPKKRILFFSDKGANNEEGGRHVKWSARKKWELISPAHRPPKKEVIERGTEYRVSGSSSPPILSPPHSAVRTIIIPCPLLLVSHFTKNVPPFHFSPKVG